jgi:hypothetical protein
MFELVSYSERIVNSSELTEGDALELERLTCTAAALRATIYRRRGNVPACVAKLRAVQRDAAVIIQRYA